MQTVESVGASPINNLQGRMGAAARAVANVAVKGLPAIRAAMHGAKLGAGAAFAPMIIERLGIRVIPDTARVVAEQLGRKAGEAAIVFRRGNSLVKAGAKSLVLNGKEGLTLRVSPRGVAVASVTEDAVRMVARTTTRGALVGIGRAAMSGAAAGAFLDGGIAGVEALLAVRRGEMNTQSAVRKVGMYAARGAVAGAAGVAAAGVVSAGMAATGFALLSAPVAIPIVTMVAAGTVASRMFDRTFGTR